MKQKGNATSHIKNIHINKRVLLHNSSEAEELLQNYLSFLISTRLVSLSKNLDYIDGLMNN